jgi:8-oxo-dGTP diphosphatase
MKNIKLTTLCYIEKDDCYLMLHRISKKNDANEGKWIGIGGHFEEGESPEECLLREVYEETGLTLTKFRLRGIITFVSDEWGTEYMHLYTGDEFEGDISTAMEYCPEGVLKWIPKKEIFDLNLWEGDKIFLKLLLEEAEMFSLKLVYEGDRLVKYICHN